jgi:hypothetical protein
LTRIKLDISHKKNPQTLVLWACGFKVLLKKKEIIGSTTNCVGKKFLPRFERMRTGEAITRIITNSIKIKFELHEFKTSLGFVTRA